MKNHSFWYYMSEKTKISNKKLIILISTIFLVLVAIGGLATAFVINYNGFTPQIPKVLDDGNSVYISAELNENYYGYRFKFVSEDKELILDTQDNVLSSEYLFANGVELGKTYNISICYLSKNSGNNSEYSKEVEWTCYDYLSAPIVEYNSEEKTFTWEEVENADYYRVYYNGGIDGYIETTETSLNLNDLECGERNLTVYAYSNFDYYKSSPASQDVMITIIKYLKNFSDLTFDYNSKIITAKSEEKYEKVTIILGSTPYEITLQNEPRMENDEYIYEINIEEIYNDEFLIGIYPQDIDKYNKYDGTSIKYYEVKFPELEEEQ